MLYMRILKFVWFYNRDNEERVVQDEIEKVGRGQIWEGFVRFKDWGFVFIVWEVNRFVFLKE